MRLRICHLIPATTLIVSVFGGVLLIFVPASIGLGLLCLGGILLCIAQYVALEWWLMRPLGVLANALQQRSTPLLQEILSDAGPLGEVARQAMPTIEQHQSLTHALAECRQSEAVLRERMEQFASITANLPGIIYRVVLEPDGRIGFPSLNLHADDLTHPDKPHPQSMHWLDRIHPDDRKAFYEVLQSSAEQLAPFDLEQRVIVEGGDDVWIRNSTWPHRRADGGIVWDGILLDITAQKGSEQILQRSLHEKESLLQEIHHRVKNNLQIIGSLLDLQALSVADIQMRAAFADSQRRVKAMALVHQQLYHSSDLAHIDFGAYVQTLIEHMLQVEQTGLVLFDLDLADIKLDTNTAIPCALIINELVSNALKHAFPDGLGGIVRVSCYQDEQQRLVLAVSDSGVGMPAEYQQLTGNTLGLQLVATLARQLHGEMKLEQHNGTTVSVIAPLASGIKAVQNDRAI